MRRELNKKLGFILNPHGFIKCRDFYIRYTNDIVQTVTFVYTPVRTEKCRGYYLDFGMASIYDHNIFGIIKDTHGCLTGRYSVNVSDFTDYLLNKKRGSSFEYSEDDQLGMFEKYCLPFLNNVRTLRDLLEARIIMQTIFNKDINYKLSPDTNLCLKLGEYDEALKRIDAAYDYYSEVVRKRSWFYYDDILSNIVRVKQLINEGDYSLVEEYLLQEKQKNIELYKSILPKRQKTGYGSMS